MPTVKAPRRILPPINPERFARNGLLVNGFPWRYIAHSINSVHAFRRKVVYSASWIDASWRDIGWDGVSATTDVGHFRFRSSHRATKLHALFTAAPSHDNATAPRITMTLDDGSPVTSDPMYLGHLDSSADAGNFSSDGSTERVSAASVISMDIDSHTTYEGYFSLVDYAAPLTVVVYEGATPTLAVSTDPNEYDAGNVLLWKHVKFLLDDLYLINRYNAAHLISWSAFETSGASITSVLGYKSFSGSTYTNVVDGFSTSVTKTTPYTRGWKLDLSRYVRTTQTTVPVRWSILMSDQSDGTSNVRAQTTSSTLFSASTTSSTAAWQTGTVDLDATSPVEFDLQANCTGTGSCRVYALSMWIEP